MRVTLDIDDRLLDALMARCPGTSRAEAIERAIDHFVDADAYARIRELRGAFPELADRTAGFGDADLDREQRLAERWRGDG